MEFIKEFGINWQVGLTIVAILVGTLILVRVVRWLIGKSFKAASIKLKVDPTRYKFFKNAISLIIWIIAFAVIILMIPKLKAFAIAIFAGAGIFLAILGLAAQQAFSNIVSGIFIVIFKPFRVGDLIKVGTLEYGVVEDISLQHTVILNFENKRIIIPNSVVSSETIINDNIEDAKICRWIDIGISYDSDLDLAIKILQEEGLKHPYSIDARTKEQIAKNEHQINVGVMNFGDSSVNLRAFVWTNDPFEARQMHRDINKSVKERFDKEETIEIPFPHRTLVYKNKEGPISEKL